MSLRVWLPLNGNLNNQGLDQVTVTNNGAVVDNNGKIGKCYSFDGSDDYISLNSSILYSIIQGGATPFSIAMWVYHADTTRAILFGDYGLSNAIGFNIELTTGHAVRFYWNGTPDKNTSSTLMDLNTWVHLTIVYDGTQILFYKNGVKTSDSYTGTLTIKTKTTGFYYLGRDSRTGTTAFNGKLNDVRIYDHALSPLEVKQISQGLILHYPLNRNGWGQENLSDFSSIINNWIMDGLTGSNYQDNNYGNVIKLTSSSTNKRMYHNVTNVWENGQIYAVSFLAKADTNDVTCDMSRSIADFTSSFSLTTKWKKYQGVITSTATASGGTLSFRIHQSGKVVYITKIKLEEGSIATPWCPNSADELYNTLGLNDNIQYDTSGYGNNGTKNNITYSNDTPKYNVSSVFNGSNSYIKVNSTNWMIKGMTALTVNFWAKTSSWPANTRLISCTESGGFNLESGNSGYWRFPVYVYTNSEKTSSGYKFDSNEIKISDLIPNEWNMITLIYDTSGTKTYINGKLHHTYTSTSYGINYNTAARLFLGCEAATASPSSPYFNGMESDFRIYATVLSAQDILSLYNNSAYIDNQGNIYGTVYEEA